METRSVIFKLLMSFYFINYVQGQVISENILQILTRTSGFYKFAQLVHRAELTEFFEVSTNMTVFTFTDKAYYQLPYTERNEIDKYNVTELQDYLKFCSVYGNRITTSSLRDNQYELSMSSNGDRLYFNRIQRIHTTAGLTYETKYYVNGVEISEGSRDISATNGIVHALNGIMRKTIQKTVYRWIQDPEDTTRQFKIFLDLMSYLYTMDSINEISSSENITTLFIPSDSAMQKIPISVLIRLKNDPSELQRVIQAHYVRHRAIFTNCIPHNESFTDANDQPLTFRKSGDNVYVYSGGSGTAIMEGNITMSNGVVHIVDQLLGLVYNNIREQIQRESISERQKKTRVSLYMETVVPEYDDITFRRMFRLKRSSVEVILQKIGERLTYEEPLRGRPPLSPEKQLLIALWYLGTQSTVLVTADRFGVTDFSVIRARRNVVEALVSVGPRVIKWPNRDEIENIIVGFRDIKGFPDVIGALDGTHVHITPPTNHPEQYINRKGFHSLQLQCVCDSNLLFIHAYVGWPGSVHDARVLKNSDLWDSGPQLCGGKHLIADSAYPLQEWLLTPFRRVGILTREQTNYNIALSTTRVLIERAFGLLKGRFKRLQHINVSGLVHTCDIIMSCCVLHNLCICQGDLLPEYFDNNEDQQEVLINAIGNVAGVVKRNQIAHRLLHPGNN